MSGPISRFRLAQFPVSVRIVMTGFVLMMLSGYLVAELNLYLTYKDADGKPGLSAEDVKRSLYGDRSKTLLASRIDGGTMEKYLGSPGDKDKILTWIRGGARETDFAAVQPAFKTCGGCHNSLGTASFRPLTNFKEVAAVATPDQGESLAKFARIAHTHLQSLALVYLALGMLFVFCGLPEKIKAGVAAMPFLALFGDFFSRGLIPHFPIMVYPMMGAGVLLGVSTFTMVGVVLWELWIARRAESESEERAAPAKEPAVDVLPEVAPQTA